MDAIRAAQAYAQAARTAAAAPADAIGDAAKTNFGEMVKSAIADTASSLQAGEGAALQVANGEANLVDVVTAISAAEASLETALAVRNRVIEAYQEIMRMPI
ncbi:MAG: flagellar hook-basal body complex protein FliE [Alphaproteobacteria bacterium RIFCSPHIGHO2_12_FULL_63_12]|nr:MAG: flagellar hook-basal body complex protein FliE [Alphaproteobacteria bacterium RIFCSPHIGHO2_12_FULL_63_12]